MIIQKFGNRCKINWAKQIKRRKKRNEREHEIGNNEEEDLKGTQTVSMYWFYLLQNHVTSTKSK